MEALKPQEYILEGVKVQFPFEAYPCQLELLQNVCIRPTTDRLAANSSMYPEQIIKTLNGKGENALLESPTGSGKSLSILCAVLGWLEHQKALRRAEAERAVEKIAIDDIKRCGGMATDGDNTATEYDPLDDFVPSKRAKVAEGGGGRREKDVGGSREKDAGELVKLSIPKIYICSRTHKQIAQLVKELERTAYSPKYVVLGSRTHYCINEKVRKTKDINEGCRTVAFSKTNPGGCLYYNGTAKYVRKRRGGAEATPDCDIEDLVRLGKAEKMCPYFVARAALEHAEVVFAPYNYLVDPVVRSAMGIELRQDIVIVDEAHNIEDVCRESGSFEVNDDSLTAIQGELLVITKNLRDRPRHQELLEAHEFQGHIVSLLLNWLRHSTSSRGQQRRDFESSITIWQDREIIEELHSLGITYEQAITWSRGLQKITDRIQEAQTKGAGGGGAGQGGRKEEQLEEKEHLLSFGSCQILKGTIIAASHLCRGERVTFNHPQRAIQ